LLVIAPTIDWPDDRVRDRLTASIIACVGSRLAASSPSAAAVAAAAAGRTEGRLLGRRPSTAQLVIAITVLGAALRFATLNVQSIWLDESATILLIHRGFSGMLSNLPESQSSPPLYYILVWAWTKVFGAGPIGFRSLSALAGTLTIPVMYQAGRHVSQRVGVWAALLTAVNPAMYYYSQEARAYALWILLTAVAFVLWQRALQAPDARRLALWAGVSILAVLTHYFTAFLFVGETIILARRLGWRRVLAPAGAVVAVGLALVPLAVAQTASGKVTWIEEASLISRLGETAKLFLVGVYGPIELVWAVLAGLLALAAAVLLVRRGDERERWQARDAAIVAAVAVVLPLLSAASHALDVYDGRNVIAVWIPFALFIACCVGTARARRSGALLGAGLCAISLAVIASIDALPAYQRDDWKAAAHALGTPARERVVVLERYGSAPLSIYLGLSALHGVNGAAVTTREVDFVALRTRRTGGAPTPARVSRTAPAGFLAAGVSHTKTFAISRFVAPRPIVVSAQALRHLSGESSAELVTQR
jgi:mannosyltransferase